MSRFTYLLTLIAVSLLNGCSGTRDDKTANGRTIVTLWIKWEGFERAALQSIVDEYNASQEKDFVTILSVSDPSKKILLATANGHPPDIAILQYFYIAAYAENNALTPLDPICDQYGIAQEDFLPSGWKACSYKGFTWAIPISVTATALHYNKALFREAGLDPERPPRTLEELEAMNDLLTQRREDGSLERIGHHPLEPGFWPGEWGLWFGGQVFRDEHIALDERAWNDTGQWLASYPERFGAAKIMKIKSSFGRVASPQNPFFTGKVAMLHQGIWMDNFVRNFASPDFEYGVAPFPASEKSGIPFISIVEPDSICIPKGAKHIEEASAFLQYLAQPANLEKLALLHGKISPLRKVSPSFLAEHPHPHIQQFLEIARSPYAMPRPQLVQYVKFQSDTRSAFENILTERITAEEAIKEMHSSQTRANQSSLKRWNRVKEARLAEWSGQEKNSAD